MALLKISEPEGTGTTRHPVGIDLGTTHSLVAAVVDGKPQVLREKGAAALLPSVVHYLTGAPPRVGAHDRGESGGVSLSSVKRFMGRKTNELDKDALPGAEWTDRDGVPCFVTPSGEVSAVAASAEILRALKQRATKVLGSEPEAAVVTVPAYFDHAQRRATSEAARMAGIRVLRLLNEPTAAAVSYGLDQAKQGVVAVYDLGGGTFDLSILRLEEGVFSVLATSGDTELGGDDLDLAVARYILRASTGAETNGSDDNSPSLQSDQWRDLLRYARTVREQLSDNDVVQLRWQDWRGEMDTRCFEELVSPFVERTLGVCRQCLLDAGLQAEDIDEVVLAGGTTRTPLVRKAVGEFFFRKPRVDIDPDEVVALGACIQAHLLSTTSAEELLLLDVVSLSLGIEVMGGLVEPIIRRNTPIPASARREFTTARDGQTALSVSVYQGERDLTVDCRFLGGFELRGIPPRTAGAVRVEIEFLVDADGLLNVRACETSTGVESGITLEPGAGLQEEDVSAMLEDAFAHVKQDKEARALHERRVQARRMLDALNSALAEDGAELLSAKEQARVAALIKKTERALSAKTGDKISSAVEELDRSTAFFAERRMDVAIKKALTGQHIDEA